MNRIVKHIDTYADRYLMGGGVIGANVGGYLFTKDVRSSEKTYAYITGCVIGYLGGAALTFLSPVLIPAMIVGAPGYMAASPVKLFKSCSTGRKD